MCFSSDGAEWNGCHEDCSLGPDWKVAAHVTGSDPPIGCGCKTFCWGEARQATLCCRQGALPGLKHKTFDHHCTAL